MGECRRFFEKLYDSEYENIKKYVCRIVPGSNGVEDIVQDTFTVAYRKRKELVHHPNVEGWLRITAKNKVMKWKERQQKYNMEMELFPNYLSENGIHRMDEYKLVDIYFSVREILSDEEFAMLRNYYEYGFTAQEMAERLKMSEASFKVRIFRMKQKIRNSLEL